MQQMGAGGTRGAGGARARRGERRPGRRERSWAGWKGRPPSPATRGLVNKGHPAQAGCPLPPSPRSPRSPRKLPARRADAPRRRGRGTPRRPPFTPRWRGREGGRRIVGDSLGGPATPLDQVLQLALQGEKRRVSRGGRARVGTGRAARTLRSRLLRMHSAAKTCSPTLLSSSMLPRPDRGTRRTPHSHRRRAPCRPHTKHRPRPVQARPAHAQRLRAPRAPARHQPVRAALFRHGPMSARGRCQGAGRALFTAGSASRPGRGSGAPGLGGLGPRAARVGQRSAGGSLAGKETPCLLGPGDQQSSPAWSPGCARPPPNFVFRAKSHCSAPKGGEVGTRRGGRFLPLSPRGAAWGAEGPGALRIFELGLLWSRAVVLFCVGAKRAGAGAGKEWKTKYWGRT